MINDFEELIKNLYSHPILSFDGTLVTIKLVSGFELNCHESWGLGWEIEGDGLLEANPVWEIKDKYSNKWEAKQIEHQRKCISSGSTLKLSINDWLHRRKMVDDIIGNRIGENK